MSFVSPGETLLHKAAIKNDISDLKQLLDVPGRVQTTQAVRKAQVNVRAMWTKQKHGHIMVVMSGANYGFLQPLPTIMSL